MKIIQFIIVLLCLGQASIAQKIFTKSELKKDFSIIRAALQEAQGFRLSYADIWQVRRPASTEMV